MRILGIDPGTTTTGFAILDYDRNHFHLIEYGCIKNPPKTPKTIRLQQTAEDLKQIIHDRKPDSLAIEEIFFSKNIKTALKVSECRGVIIQNAYQSGLTVHEYSPNQVKSAICGYGHAEKIQIQKMVKLILKLKKIPKPDDAADAIAIAICHAQTLKLAPSSNLQ